MSSNHRKTAAHQPPPHWRNHPVANDTPFKICRCKDPETGKLLRSKCPKLRRANRSWNPVHGQWAYQLELPPTADGKRRQLRPSTGFADRDAAEAEIDHVRQLLGLARKDKDKQGKIADLVQNCWRTGADLPDVDTLRQRLRMDSPLSGVPTVAEYLTRWVKDIDVDENTRRTYANNITTHLTPTSARSRSTSSARTTSTPSSARSKSATRRFSNRGKAWTPPYAKASPADAPPERRPVPASAPPCAKPSTTPFAKASSPA